MNEVAEKWIDLWYSYNIFIIRQNTTMLGRYNIYLIGRLYTNK